MYVNNPFAGSMVKITKRITRKTYDEKYSTEYVYNAELNCDYNEFYKIVTNGVDYILVRESNKD